jgi:uncharacterized lipoprotein YmbA
MKLAPIVIAATLLLGACASSPDVRFYTLDTMPADAGVKTTGKTIGLGPLRIPDYLKRPQIVTQESGNQLNIAEYDRWAEPVERVFARTLVTNVDALLNSAIVIQFPYNAMLEPDIRVIGRVQRFDADETGTAILSIQWGAVDGKGGSLIAPRRGNYKATINDPKDYGSIVRALSQTVELLSKDMAATLSPLL